MLWIYHISQYAFIKFIYDKTSFDVIQPYVNNVEKAKQYIWFILHHLFIYLHTCISYYYRLSDSMMVCPSIEVHPYVVSLYELEKAVYFYDIISVIHRKDWVFFIHHILTLFSLWNSEMNHSMESGTYILFLMNSTSVNLYIARLLRQFKDTKWVIVGDTLFLGLFGYFRIWRLSLLFAINLINNSKISWKHYSIVSFLWLLQWIWFIKLSHIYYINYIQSIENKNKSNSICYYDTKMIVMFNKYIHIQKIKWTNKVITFIKFKLL